MSADGKQFDKHCLQCGATSESQCAIKADPVGNYCIYVVRLEHDIDELKHDLAKALANHSADLSAKTESPVTPEQFTDLLKRIAVRMGGHTIPVIHGPAWHNFMGLLRQVTPYECGIGPMPSEGNSPYVNCPSTKEPK